MSSSVILAASVSDISCGKTDKRTNGGLNPTLTTSVVSNNRPIIDLQLLRTHVKLWFEMSPDSQTVNDISVTLIPPD